MVSWVSECKRTRMRGYICIYSVWHLFNVEYILSFLCFSLWVCFHCWDRILMFTGYNKTESTKAKWRWDKNVHIASTQKGEKNAKNEKCKYVFMAQLHSFYRCCILLAKISSHFFCCVKEKNAQKRLDNFRHCFICKSLSAHLPL